jgi:alkylation response protein AidB-like acyl-CoA dehydrogenase
MVAAFGLGAGIAALNKAIAYSMQRRTMGTLLCEKQGYTHKLLVPNSVRLAAAKAYIEHVADLLDSGNKDRQVEGAIAKIFATEAGNLAADDAVQALGGYGYCVEFEVEKIRRDARVLRIYEGTSEILQNIVGLYRMRESVRSKGRYYAELADQVEPFTEAGGPAVAKTARFLSTALDLLFHKKLAQQQHALFECATSIVEVETAAALVRAAGISDDPILQAQSRVFGSDIALSVPTRLLKIFADDNAIRIAADLDGAVLLQAGRMADLDAVAHAITHS